MKQDKLKVGFIGSGGIARAHAFAINSMRYYYDDSPDLELEAVCSATESHRESFAGRYGFNHAQTPEDFFNNKKIDTVFILGPNNVHFEHLKAASEMAGVRRIYLEKPVCSTVDEELKTLSIMQKHSDIKIQVGFQYLFSTQTREALSFWKSGRIGQPVHFDLKYFHGDYLHENYRLKRRSRLTAAPDGGAMADLGSHAISFIIAFLGDNIEITGALQAGNFRDVPEDSDLFSLINLFDPVTRAAGTLSASRISSGTGDMKTFELYGEKGALKFSTCTPDYFEYYLEGTEQWCRQITASDYRPLSTFPSVHVPPGWLRSMIHAHYVFLTGNDRMSFIPDIKHGLSVQRIVRQTAEHLSEFRNNSKVLNEKTNFQGL